MMPGCGNVVRRGTLSFCTVAAAAAVALVNLSSKTTAATAWSDHRIGNNRDWSSRRRQSSSSVNSMASSGLLQVAQFSCLTDNYGYLIHDVVSGNTAAIDTPCATTYQRELEQRGWKLTHIFNTHHHWDHTGGNQELKTKGVTVVGPAVEQEKIPGIDVTVQGGDCLEFGDHQVHVMDVGGHTRGHVAYYFEAEKKVFCGDALFVMGCGKMFEGTPTQFWQSLQRLRDLPEDALVYCAHEYTLSNAKFAVSVEPSNAELMQRYHQVQQQRSRGEPTVPTMIGLEKKTNPFLRVDVSDEIRSKLGVGPQDTHADAFAKVRRAKDVFRG